MNTDILKPRRIAPDDGNDHDHHEHRYFIFKTFETYEAIPEQADEPYLGHQLYIRVEYAILGCNCGNTIKERIKQR